MHEDGGGKLQVPSLTDRLCGFVWHLSITLMGFYKKLVAALRKAARALPREGVFVCINCKKVVVFFMFCRCTYLYL